jgi:hypothetical protein
MRSMLELLHYLTFIGDSVVGSLVHPTTDGTGMEAVAAASKHAGTMKFDEFPEWIEKERTAIISMLEPLSEEDILTRQTSLPWGQPIALYDGITNNAMRYFCAYRHQLFLYARMCGVKIGTSNNWRGVDTAPPAPKTEAPKEDMVEAESGAAVA